MPRGHRVSIHAPAWGATSWDQRGVPSLLFQSTRPRGARLFSEYEVRELVVFQSTRPRGARPDQQQNYFNALKFQSTRPRGARPSGSPGYFNPLLFQSTRPRGARQPDGRQRDRLARVSIHAPAWGATCRHRLSTCSRSCFNPRARVGRDPFCSCHKSHVHVSIHAPAWGATVS